MGPGVCYYPQPPAEECVPVANAPSKYIRVDQTLSFDDARAYCQEHFHDLASIHNAHENAQAVLACEGGGVVRVEQAALPRGDTPPPGLHGGRSQMRPTSWRIF